MAVDASRKVWAQGMEGSEAEFHALLDAAVDAIIMIDSGGRILTFNGAAERIFGYAASEVLGRDVALLMPEPHRSAHGAYLQRYLRSGDKRVIGIGREVEAQRRDGSIFPAELAIDEVDTGGDPRFVGIIRDISARKQAEREARDLQERLARVGRFSVVGEMAAGIAHEINQPLTAVSTYAQAGRRMLASGAPVDTEDLLEIFAKLDQQARRAGEVIAGLRAFTKRHEAQREPVDCNEIVGEIMDLATMDAMARQVPLEAAYAELPLMVLADRVQLQQVVLNLIRNAVDAVAECPERAIPVTVCTSAREQEVEVRVTDHGPGVDPKIANELFNPFMTTKPGGMGVGLSISRTIVKAHGGQLLWEPNPDGGAVFRFLLPLYVEE